MSEDLIKAAKENDVERLKKILIENKDNKYFSINYEDSYHLTALMRACDKGNYQAAEFLINNGADINVRARNQYKNSALLCASEDHLDIVVMLIKNGADINVENYGEGKIAIEVAMYASKNGQSELTDLLMKKFDLDKINNAFLEACYYGDLEKTKFLLNKGADINYKIVDLCGRGKTALGSKIIEAFYASTTNSFEQPGKYGYHDNDQNYKIIELLVKNGADLEIHNWDDSPDLRKWTDEDSYIDYGKGTPLFIAVSTENYAVSELLIKNGADTNTGGWGSCTVEELLINRNSGIDQKLLAFIEKFELENLIELTVEIEIPSLGNASIAQLPVQPVQRTLSQKNVDHAALMAMIEDPEVEPSERDKNFNKHEAKVRKQLVETEQDYDRAMGL